MIGIFQGYKMTECHSFVVDKSIPETIQSLFLLKVLFNVVHKKFNSFRTKEDIGQFMRSIMRNDPFLSVYFDEEKCTSDIKEDHVFLQLLRLMVLQCSRVRFGFLDGQKRHYIMTMCLCNKKPEYFTLGPSEEKCIDASTSKSHLSQFGLMTKARSYHFVTDRFLRTCDMKSLFDGYNPSSEFDVLGKKSFPMLKKKSHYVIESHEKHQASSFLDFLNGWLAMVKNMGSKMPDRAKPVLELRGTYYSAELKEMRWKVWIDEMKNNAHFCYEHMNNLRAIAAKGLVEEEKLPCVVDLKTTDIPSQGDFDGNIADYHKYLMQFCGEKKGPCGLVSQNSMSGRYSLTSLVLFMTSMYYNPETFENFVQLVRANGSMTANSLHKSIHDDLLKGSLSSNCVSVLKTMNC